MKAVDGQDWRPGAASRLENPVATSALNHSADREDEAPSLCGSSGYEESVLNDARTTARDVPGAWSHGHTHPPCGHLERGSNGSGSTKLHHIR